MSLYFYLVQYTPDLQRQERFNVGLILGINDDMQVRFLSDEQWQARFDSKGFSNWQAWRNYYDRVLTDRGIPGVLADNENKIPSTYTVIEVEVNPGSQLGPKWFTTDGIGKFGPQIKRLRKSSGGYSGPGLESMNPWGSVLSIHAGCHVSGFRTKPKW
jgi:hypothetical protein